jgi:hypothetical protein
VLCVDGTFLAGKYKLQLELMQTNRYFHWLSPLLRVRTEMLYGFLGMLR